MKAYAFLDSKSSDYVTSSSGIDFSEPSSDTNGKGLYILTSSKNDEYPIYYYRGNVTDNNVLFGNYCWKIVRTTETGGIKLVYNGVPTEGKCNNTGLDTELAKGIKFATSYNNTSYFGYAYGTGHAVKTKANTAVTNGTVFASDVTYENGKYILSDDQYVKDDNFTTDRDAQLTTHHYTCFSTSTECTSVNFVFFARDAGMSYIILSNEEKIDNVISNDFLETTNVTSSTIKKYIEDWYENNMTSQSDYLEDAVWCNDRSIYSKGGWEKNGDVTKKLTFNGLYRISESFTPSLTCSNPNDRFTTETSNGNGKSRYKIGLLTLDESMLAGFAWNIDDESSYLYNGYVWWAMTPTLQSSVYMYEGVVHSMLDNVHTAYISGDCGGVRPAISLDHNMIITSGNGTGDEPFIFELPS